MYKLFTKLFLIISFSSIAQLAPTHDFLISPQAHYGFIIAHRNNMGQLVKGHIYGGELNYIFRTDGIKQWQQIHKYPDWGICFLHLYLANPQQLGNLEALYPYVNLRLNKLKRKTFFNLRLGVGLGYITKPFDRITNHKNNAIGSHINGFVCIRLNITRMLSQRWRLDAGVGLQHASNGAFQTPNLGLNMATINLGVAYVFGNKNLEIKKDSVPKPKKQLITQVIGVVGIKEVMPPGGEKFLAYGLMLNEYCKLNDKNKLGLGVELSYSNATKQDLRDDSIFTFKDADIVRAGVKICYAFNVHRVSLPIDFGFYFYKKQSYDGLFFHRIGIQYLITKHLVANVTLITHWARADYFEYGIGYQF